MAANFAKLPDLATKLKAMTKTTLPKPPKPPTEPPPKLETQRERFTRLVSGNPRFKEVKPSGKAFIIVGAKPSRPPDAG
jgi:hypothetical protein